MDKKRVMVAEDDLAILEAMQIMLEDDGYEVTAIADGRAVQEMKGELPHLLLLDIWMSGLDGTAICRQLKGQERTRGVPIIICSANKDTAMKAKECGADDSIAKPFEMSELLAKVRKHIDRIGSAD